jgi:hypothetical protein
MSLSKFSDPFAPVSIERVSVAGKEIAKLGIMLKDDAGELQNVGIISEGFQLIQNAIARDVALDVMSRSGLGWKSHAMLFNGRNMLARYITENPITEIRNGSTHQIHLGLSIRNGYDGSSAFGFDIFALNSHCQNQYVSRNLFGSYVIRHVGEEFDVGDALKNISSGAERVIAAAPRIRELMSRSIGVKDLVEAREKTTIPGSKWGDVLSQLGKEQERGTAFGLFQALTFVATHELTGFSAVAVGESITDLYLKDGTYQAASVSSGA